MSLDNAISRLSRVGDFRLKQFLEFLRVDNENNPVSIEDIVSEENTLVYRVFIIRGKCIVNYNAIPNDTASMLKVKIKTIPLNSIISIEEEYEEKDLFPNGNYDINTAFPQINIKLIDGEVIQFDLQNKEEGYKEKLELTKNLRLFINSITNSF